MKKILYLLVPLLAFVLPGVFASAATIVPCTGGDACKACHLIELANNIINFLIVISVLIASILFAWAGFIMVTSAGNMSKVKKAKDIFVDVLIGIIIVLSGWIIVNTVMSILVGDTLFGGSWKTIECVDNGKIIDPGNVPVTPTPNPDPTNPGGPVTIPAGDFAAAIGAYTGQSTTAGPDGGNKACVWAVNNVLESAGYAPIARSTENVGHMEDAIRGGRGEQVADMSQAQPGDIVISSGRQHVGMCLNAGCSQIISNASSARTFSWRSNVNFDGYYGGASRVYRVNKGR